MALLKSLPEAIERTLAERTEIYNQRLDARESAEADKALEAEQSLDSAADAVDTVLGFYVRQIQLWRRFDLDTQSAKASALEQLSQRADNTVTRLKVNQEDAGQSAGDALQRPGERRCQTAQAGRQ